MEIWLFIFLLPWRLLQGDICASTQSQRGRTLSGHLIERWENTDLTRCSFHCGENPQCYSFNFYSNICVCELNNATHLSHPEDLQSIGEAGHYTIYFLRPFSCSKNLCCQGELSFCSSLCVLHEDGLHYWCNGCQSVMALGMESGAITDSQITSSSNYDSNLYSASEARLNHSRAWASGFNKVGEYLQVDMESRMRVEKIATQGHPKMAVTQWIKTYSLASSNDNITWVDYCYSNGSIVVFSGNHDRDSIVTHSLHPPIQARYIRVLPQTWFYWMALRLELYGCSVD